MHSFWYMYVGFSPQFYASTFADAKLIKKKGMASVSRTIHRFGYKCALTLWVDKKWTVVNLDMPDYFSTCQKGPMMESRQDEFFFLKILLSPIK